MAFPVTLRQIRILMDSFNSPLQAPTLKITTNRQIHKSNNLVWNNTCHRWQQLSDFKLELTQLEPLELELYRIHSKTVEVLGQSRVEVGLLAAPFGGELKNCLMLEGRVVGWLYCELQVGPERMQSAPHFLYIHKLSLDLLQPCHSGNINILLNGQQLYSKQFTLSNKKRTLFPNLKAQAIKSDCLVLQLLLPNTDVLPLSFVLDQITCGQTTTMAVWLRNKGKVKIGQIQVEYYQDSVHLKDKDRELVEKHFQPKRSIASMTVTKASRGKVSIMTRQGSWLNNNGSGLHPNNIIKKSILSFTNLKSREARVSRGKELISSSKVSEYTGTFPKIL